MVDFDELKERGEEMVEEWEERFRDWMEATFEKLGIATRADIELLEDKITKIEKLLSEGLKASEPKPMPRPKKKPAAKKSASKSKTASAKKA